jgi:uracil-DNA glycosylase
VPHRPRYRQEGMRVVLIGQAPGPNTNPDAALYPQPRTSAGGRLCEFFGMTQEAYLQHFTRMNLLYAFPGRDKRDDKFPTQAARHTASSIRPLLEGATVIMVGRKVAEAFGYSEKTLNFFEWKTDALGRFQFACIPHPSGRNFIWKDKRNILKCREFLATVRSAFLTQK